MEIIDSVNVVYVLIKILIGLVAGIPSLLGLFYGLYLILTDARREAHEETWKRAADALHVLFQYGDKGFALRGNIEGVDMHLTQQRSLRTLLGNPGDVDLQLQHALPLTQPFSILPNETPSTVGHATGDPEFDQAFSVLASSPEPLVFLTREVRQALLHIAAPQALHFHADTVSLSNLPEPSDAEEFARSVVPYTHVISLMRHSADGDNPDRQEEPHAVHHTTSVFVSS